MAAPLVSAAAADAAIARLEPRSPLIGKGALFAAAAERHNVDWRLLVAIAYAETELGVTGNAAAIYNPFGLGPGIRFNSWASSIDRAAELLAQYRADGLESVAEIGSRWAPVGAQNDPRNLNSNWTRNVSSVYRSLGGDPGAPSDAGSSIGPDNAGEVGDAVQGAGDALSGGLGALADLAARLASRELWLRVLMALGGLVALVLGIVLGYRSMSS